ncbi:hypothetical protein EDB81DRAFT_676144 [Dactylonectria macrodidyma]|uniref:FAD/NAD(P)-binding domain-containing protein n=1 Tax=Dactylonectria macrodidyma TaxID=307937 RepID=A0A9P9JJN3_9HYPO|nr:hypothetical protein EDB81DRAFT_676144 [Dactylonectria macrodidyma]
MSATKQRVLVIGTGWAGYELAQEIDLTKYELTVVSPETTQALTPLLASAACGLFAPYLAYEPIRRKSRKVRFLQAYVDSIDFDARAATCRPAFAKLSDQRFTLEYDKVIIAPGCQTNTFDTPGVAEHAFFVKSVADARAVRQRLEDMLEIASLPGVSEERQRELCHVIIVGGGPTGVEMAAELSDLFIEEFSHLYSNLRGKMRVSVHDVADNILCSFDAKLQEYATKSLSAHRVEVKADSHITKVTEDTIETKEDGKIGYGMLIWATGNKSISLVGNLKVKKTDGGLTRILTDEHLHVLRNGHADPNAFALGDAADVEGQSLPTIAQVALQKAVYLVRVLNSPSTKPEPFRYKQKAAITYTGAKDGVVAGKDDYSGYGAWLSWRSANVMWTRSFRRKLMISITWVLNYFGGRDVARN